MSLEQAVVQLEQTNAALQEEVVRFRDAAMGLNNIWPTITEGRQNTADGKYFSVPGNGAYMRLYRRTGVQASLIAEYPSVAAMEEALAAATADAEARAASEANRAEQEADRANTFADNSGYVTRERLRKTATLDLSFSEGRYSLDDGERLDTNNANDILTVERATPTWALSADGKYREVPINKIARDWNPTTGQYEAQISRAMTNELLWSTDFSKGVWAKSNGMTVEPGATDSVIQGQSADKIIPAAGQAFSRISQSRSITGVCTALCLFKPAGYDSLRIEPSGSAGAAVVYNSSTDDFDLAEGGVLMHGRIKLGDGYFLVYVNYEIATASSILYVYSLPSGETSGAYGGYDGVSGAYIANAQLVGGTTPGPVIVTEDSPVTRAADNISRELGEEFNASGFTSIYSFYGDVLTSTSSSHIFSLSTQLSSSSSPRVSFRVASNGDRNIQILNDSGDVWANSNIIPNLLDGFNKIGVSVDQQSGAYSIVVNGAVVSQGSGLVGSFSGVTRQWLQSFELAASLKANNCALLPVALTAAQLQELTQ